MNKMSVFYSKFARKIFLLFIVSALLPVCVLAFLSLQKVSARLEEGSLERLRHVCKNAGMTVLEELSLTQRELEALPVSGARSTQSVSRPLESAEAKWRILNIAVNVGPEVKGLSGFSDQFRLSKAMLSHLSAGNALLLTDGGNKNNLHMITASNSALSSGSLLSAEINPEYLWELARFTLPSGIELIVVDHSGRSLFTSLNMSPVFFDAVRANMRNKATGQFEWNGDEQEYFVSYWSVFMKPAYLADSWVIVTVQSKDEALGPARSFVRTFQLVVVLTLLVVIFFSSLLIRQSLVPLSILRDGARRLSAGDFETRVKISSGDEFEELSVSFNNMSEQLGKQFNRLGEMGVLVAKILETHDRNTIVSAVMSRFRYTVPCEWLAIAIAGGHTPEFLNVFHNSASDVESEKISCFQLQLSEEEFKKLTDGSQHIYVEQCMEFKLLLEPMAAVVGNVFYLMPILLKERLMGVLVIGYHYVPELITDDLTYSRQVANELAIALENVRLIEELNLLNLGTVETLANAVDAKSPWTAGHSDRVTRLALEIGKEMGLSSSDMKTLLLGGRFHDIGKIGIPESLLDKSGRLTDDEYAILKQHPEKGVEILKPIQAYYAVIPIVGQHHERFDGQGYPLGLAGNQIVIGARIMAVADVFDALHSSRPYRPSWELETVYTYLRDNSGTQFDPDVVDAFLKIVRSVYADLSYNDQLLKD